MGANASKFSKRDTPSNPGHAAGNRERTVTDSLDTIRERLTLKISNRKRPKPSNLPSLDNTNQPPPTYQDALKAATNQASPEIPIAAIENHRRYMSFAEVQELVDRLDENFKRMRSERDIWKTKAKEERARLETFEAERRVWEWPAQVVKLNEADYKYRIYNLEKERDEWKMKAEKIQAAETECRARINDLQNQEFVLLGMIGKAKMDEIQYNNLKKERDAWKAHQASWKESSTLFTKSPEFLTWITTICEYPEAEIFREWLSSLADNSIREERDAWKATAQKAQAKDVAMSIALASETAAQPMEHRILDLAKPQEIVIPPTLSRFRNFEAMQYEWATSFHDSPEKVKEEYGEEWCEFFEMLAKDGAERASKEIETGTQTPPEEQETDEESNEMDKIILEGMDEINAAAATSNAGYKELETNLETIVKKAAELKAEAAKLHQTRLEYSKANQEEKLNTTKVAASAEFETSIRNIVKQNQGILLSATDPARTYDVNYEVFGGNTSIRMPRRLSPRRASPRGGDEYRRNRGVSPPRRDRDIRGRSRSGVFGRNE